MPVPLGVNHADLSHGCVSTVLLTSTLATVRKAQLEEHAGLFIKSLCISVSTFHLEISFAAQEACEMGQIV